MAAVLAFAPPGASAAAPPGFVGMQSWLDPSGTRLDQLQKARVTTYRTQLAWSSVQPHRSEPYRWGRYDRMFEMAAKRNIRMIPVLLGSPKWVDSRPQDPPITDSERKAFYAFANAAARRYGPRSTFWRSNGFDGARVGVKYFQTWNESNLRNYWNGAPNARQYARMVRGTHQAVRAGDRSATTILAGMPFSNQGVDPLEYVKAMFRADPEISDSFSAAAIHPYATTPDKAVHLGVGAMRKTLDGLGATGKEIWVTEIGWASGTPDGRFQVKETTQASYLESFFQKLIGNRVKYKVLGAVWFNHQDLKNADWWAERTGLLKWNGYSKPAWWRLHCVTGAPGCKR